MCPTIQDAVLNKPWISAPTALHVINNAVRAVFEFTLLLDAL